jgi:hypothetical protein
VICPACGVQVLAGYRFCHRCRRRLFPDAGPVDVSAGARATPHERRAVSPSRPGRRRFARPRAITALAALDLATAALLLVMVLGGAVSFFGGKDAAVDLGLAGGAALLAFALVVAGVGLLRLRRFGRTFHIALAAVALPLIPFGTLVGALLLAWFLRPGAKALFSEVDPKTLPPREQEAARQAAGSTGLLAMGTAAAAVPPIGICAAVVFVMMSSSGSPKQARDEPSALAEVRAVAAAERAFADLDDGRYAAIECLAAPAGCLPGFPPTATAFLPERLVGAGPRHGYRFAFHPAPPSTKRLGSWAFVAAPEGGDGRWLCADAGGRVCAGMGRPPKVLAEGRCPASCEAFD